MQLMSLRSLQLSWLACLALLALAACNQGKADAAPGKSEQRAGKTSYQLVTQLRPESAQLYFKNVRDLYDLCVAAASQKGLAVKPFPTLPPDFVVARTVYASDGKRTAFKETEWMIDSDDRFGPETGCELQIRSHWRSEVTEGARARTAGRTADGQYEIGDWEEASDESIAPARLSSYTVDKEIRGVRLKCNADDSCIVDPGLALIGSGQRPVLAAARNADGPSPLILEPVSLSVSKTVDANVFKQENME